MEVIFLVKEGQIIVFKVKSVVCKMVINSVERKIKQGRGMKMLGVQDVILNNVVRVSKKMIVEPRSEGGEGLKHMEIWVTAS